MVLFLIGDWDRELGVKFGDLLRCNTVAKKIMSFEYAKNWVS